MGFWESPVGEALSLAGALSVVIAAIAGGLKGVGYLTQKGVWGFRKLRNAARGVGRLAEIANEDAWPNGSTDLPTFLDGVHHSLQEIKGWTAEHDAHHIDITAEIENRRA